jgi:hypothetical protein
MKSSQKGMQMNRHEEIYRGFKLVVQKWKGVLQGCAIEGDSKRRFSATGSSTDEILRSLKTQIGTVNVQPPEKLIQYVATANSTNRVFHKHSCGWMNGVTCLNEIKFNNREDAKSKGYTPCFSCRP